MWNNVNVSGGTAVAIHLRVCVGLLVSYLVLFQVLREEVLDLDDGISRSYWIV